MDILQLLDHELKKSNWSLEEKKRHLYIRSCQLFTYDTRHYFVSKNSTNIRNASAILNSINNREIDLTHVTDNRVNCYSWAKVYKTLQKELLNANAEVEENIFGTHAWVFFGHKADATVDSDLSRVKMKLYTKGYELSTERDQFVYDYETPKKIKTMDKNIKYIKDNYYNFEPLVHRLQLEFQERNISKEDTLFWWLYHLMDIFEQYNQDLIYFEDASFGLSYLLRYFIAKEERKNIERITLFDDTNDDWDFIDIYKIPYLGDIFYYALLPQKNGYHFIEIPYLDVLNYASSLQGPKKERLLKN